MSCVACQGPLSLFGRRADYEYHQCSACRTIQLVPFPDSPQLAAAYDGYTRSTHYERDPGVSRVSGAPYYRELVRVLRDLRVDGPVLDYGSGWGGLCETLLEQGFAVEGVELTREMAEYCRELGLPVRQGDIHSVADRRFSAIVLCAVFEHLVDHEEWLARASGLLEEGGLLVSLQPTAPFAGFAGRLALLARPSTRRLPALHQVFCPPWHTALFSLDGMETLLARHGLRLVQVRPGPQGRQGGLNGVLQRGLGALNRVGWRLFGTRWPLLISHILVFRKTRPDRA